MSKYLVLNDPHVDVRAPSFRRRDDYLAACLDKLAAVGELCRAHQVEVLCCTGDWFHKKHPQAVPHRLVRAILEWTHWVTDELHVPISTVIGNHDVQFNDTSLASVQSQPLGVLLTNPSVHLLDHHPRFLGNAVLCGSSYRKAIAAEDGSSREDLDQFRCLPPLTETERRDHWVVQLTHASVVPEPVMWHPHTPMAVAMELSGADIMHTGHIHEDLGIHTGTRANGERWWWANTGSMTRGALTEETVTREPNVLLVELGSRRDHEVTMTRLVLPHAPAEQIYDVASYRETKVQTKEFGAWTDRLRKELNGTETTADKTLAQIVQESTLDPAARDLALRILNRAGA